MDRYAVREEAQRECEQSWSGADEQADDEHRGEGQDEVSPTSGDWLEQHPEQERGRNGGDGREVSRCRVLRRTFGVSAHRARQDSARVVAVDHTG